jgi:N-acetylmuramoyl-L-alanine amidase
MKFFINAGHSYNTAGKRTPDGSMREWEFNHAVAEYIKNILNGYQGVEVLFPHDPTGKVDISLKKRTDYANHSGADVYVSIHANAYGNGWNTAKGIETFVHTSKPKVATNLANLVQKKLIAKTGRSNRGVKTANFHELRETKMPTILVECGFMTNKEEAALLKSESYRQKCAKAIADSLIEFYNLKPKIQKESTPMKPNWPKWKWEEAAYIYQKAYEQKIFSSAEWSKKAKEQSLTYDDIIYLNLALTGRTLN